ncbi:hypothetical protein F0U44_06700 [Nocardioides humilatus]|uniref:Uncharacterized protein n=1 Tax=Nocardioides humilatus TaxID=2607660 RepID=A0A5B1LN50_9ACTN|nr:hypothetical protein [Nocardioides humilatus]KAA1421944.1 hypothetical protein F0U44_06700 [Nocardioides humilatus]
MIAIRTTFAQLMAGLVAGLLVALGCSLVPGAATAAPAAAAIDCEDLDLANTTAVVEKADAVSDVFAGKVRSAKAVTAIGGGAGRAGQEDKPRQPSDWEHAVQVTASFRTELQPGDQVPVFTTPLATDGLGKLEIGATYLFFVTTEAGMDHYDAEPCSGTMPLRGGLSAQQQSALEDALGDASGGVMPEVELSAPSDGTRSIPEWSRLAAPGAAVTLIGVLGLMLLSRVGSRRA